MSMVTFEKQDLFSENCNVEYIGSSFHESGELFSVAKLSSFNKEFILSKAMNQALLKSQFTNNGNQNNQSRTAFQKLNKQFQGIFAEIIVFEFLSSIFNRSDISVQRYDDVRTDDFKSPSGEYDIKIQRGQNIREIEVRSSISYKKDMSYETLRDFHVIGPYTNKAKKHEAMNDYYIRPIFQLKNIKQNINLANLNIIELIVNDEIDFYITGGCTKKMMLQNCETVSMGQRNTQYDALPVLNSLDIVSLTKLFRQLRNGNK